MIWSNYLICYTISHALDKLDILLCNEFLLSYQRRDNSVNYVISCSAMPCHSAIICMLLCKLNAHDYASEKYLATWLY